MAEITYTPIDSVSAAKIDSLANAIKDNVDEIHAFVQPSISNVSWYENAWINILSWFETAWFNIQDYFHFSSWFNRIMVFWGMDLWNLIITILVLALSARFWKYLYSTGWKRIRESLHNHNIEVLSESDVNENRLKPNSSKQYNILINIKRLHHKGWHIVKKLPKIIIDFVCELIVYKKNHIEFDRKILSTNGKPLFDKSLKLAVLLPITTILIFAPLGILYQIFKGGKYATAIGVFDTGSSNQTNILWAALSQYLDPGNISNSDGFGSFVAIFLATSGIVCLSGLLVSSIVNWISQRRERWQKGLILYDNVDAFDDYVVIIGVNDLTAHIIKTILKKDKDKYILIQTRQDVEKMRMRLDLSLDKKEEDKLVFYYGERTSYEDIEKLHLEKVTQIFILGEDVTFEDEEDHDAYNIECLRHISQYIKNNNCCRIRCHVNFEYQSTFTAFKSTHIYQDFSKQFDFFPFNVHDIWAKKVLVDNFAIVPDGAKGGIRVQRYIPFDTYEVNRETKGITQTVEMRNESTGEVKQIDNPKTVHFIILGMNQMGTALATQVALLAHFPNFTEENNRRTTITFIDDHAKEEGEYLRGRYASLFELCRYRTIDCKKHKLSYNRERDNGEITEEIKQQYVPYTNPLKEGRYSHLSKSKGDNSNFMDIQWEFIEGNIASDEVKEYITNVCKDEDNVTTIAICFNDPQQAIASALYLPSLVFSYARQILVYQKNSFDLIKKISEGEKDWTRYKILRPFGMTEGSYTENIFDNSMAKLDSYVYKKVNEIRDRITDLMDCKEDELDNVQKELIELYSKLDKTVIAQASDIRDGSHKLLQDFKNSLRRDEDLYQKINAHWEGIGIVHKLASIDSVDSMNIRLRSMGIKYDGNPLEVQTILKKHISIDVMTETEHRRWMAQRLLSGYRPLDSKVNATNKKEVCWEDFAEPNEKQEWRTKREVAINQRRAYLEICPYRCFDVLGTDMKYKDESVIRFIPYLLIHMQWYNILKLSDSSRSGVGVLLAKKFLFDNNKMAFSFIEKDKKEVKDDDKIKIKNHSFWMAKNVVSQELWNEVMQDHSINQSEETMRMPVTMVSKESIEDFLTILRKQTGIYFSLPSMKEWRYAVLLKYAFFNAFDFDNKEDRKQAEDSIKYMTEINCKRGIECGLEPVGGVENDDSDVTGLQHLLGNVWEWTRTAKDKDNNSDKYYLCGGSWQFKIKECNVTDLYWKTYHLSSTKSNDMGFRLIIKFDYNDIERFSTDKEKPTHQNINIFRIANQRNLVEDTISNKERIATLLSNSLVKIGKGYFLMGTENTETIENHVHVNLIKEVCPNINVFFDKDSGAEETPHHFVKIDDDFYIGNVPVTQELWNLVKGKKALANPAKILGDHLPQTNVSWNEVQKFITQLNELFADELAKENKVFRLPTEAEWEYAAKGGDGTETAKGLWDAFEHNDDKDKRLKDAYLIVSKYRYKRYSGSNFAKDVAWYKLGRPHEVGSKEPNVHGIYDMSGNVWEWCWDYYQSDIYNDCISGEGCIAERAESKEYETKGYITNPICDSEEYSAHVFRGGSWASSRQDCRCTRANYWVEDFKSDDLGFRLVKGYKIETKLQEYKNKNNSHDKN